MGDARMVLAAALMLAGAFIATGAWLIPRRGVRYLLVVLGALVFAGGIVALTLAIEGP